MRTSVLKRDPLFPGICEVCGKPCELEDAVCGITCEAELGRREREQGREVLRLLKRWRRYRGRKGTPGEGAISQVAETVDRFLRLDRERRDTLTQQRVEKANDSEDRKTP